MDKCDSDKIDFEAKGNAANLLWKETKQLVKETTDKRVVASMTLELSKRNLEVLAEKRRQREQSRQARAASREQSRKDRDERRKKSKSPSKSKSKKQLGASDEGDWIYTASSAEKLPGESETREVFSISSGYDAPTVPTHSATASTSATPTPELKWKTVMNDGQPIIIPIFEKCVACGETIRTEGGSDEICLACRMKMS